MRYRFVTADVFTDRIFGGNPLAVFPDGQGLDGERMQQVARELNLSETVFVLPPEDPSHTRRLRIFTPGVELPFAGHPTVGAAYLLAALGEIALSGETTRIVFEEGVGPVPVEIRAEDGRPVFSQLSAAQLPEQGPAPPPATELAQVLSLTAEDLLQGDDKPETWSCGVPFLFIPVVSRAALGRVRIDMSRWQSTLADFWAPNVFVFTPEAGEGADRQARMFPPAMEIPEDPATGAAAAAFAGYLASRAAARDGTCRWVVAQGLEMGRPSRIEIEADKAAGQVTAVRVGGATVLVSEGEMEVPA